MLIQIRGTSGSGKSVAMRKVMDAIGGWEPKYIPGRKRPLYYVSGEIAVLGHYEIACGGCDTIGSVPQIFAALDTLLPFRYVLAEGLLLSEDVIWTAKKPESKVLFLTTPGALCLERVGKRQDERGRKPSDPERVERKLMRRVDTIERARQRLVRLGVECRRCSADQAPGIVLSWLGIK